MVSPLLLCTSYRPSASDFCTELIFNPGTASVSRLAMASSVSPANTAGTATKDIIRPVTAAAILRFMDQKLPFPVNRFRHFACPGPSYATTGIIPEPCDRAPRKKFTPRSVTATGMMGLVQILQPLPGHMGIDLCGRKVRMPEQHLHYP